MKRYRFIGTEEQARDYDPFDANFRPEVRKVYFESQIMAGEPISFWAEEESIKKEWEDAKDSYKLACELTDQIFEIINSSEHSGAEAEERIIELLERNL